MHKEDKTLKALAAVYDKYNVTSEEEVFVSTWGADEKACRADIVKKFPPARAAELLKASEELKTIISNHIQEMIDGIADVISTAELKKKAESIDRLPARYKPEDFAILNITAENFRQRIDEKCYNSLSVNKGKYQYTLSNIDIEITLSRILGTSTKKLAFYILSLVTLAQESETEVYLNIDEYAKLNNKDIGTESKKREFLRQIRQDLRALRNLNIRPDDGDDGEEPFIGRWVECRSKGEYKIEFLKSTMSKLKNQEIPLILIPLCLYHHSNKDPNAFAIGLKLVANYDNDNNKKQKKHNILSVKSLLKFAPSIQNIDEYKKTGRGHYKTDLKAKLEKALDDNVKIGYLQNWSYKRPGNKGEKINREDIESLDEFSKLMIEFTPKIIDISCSAPTFLKLKQK